jgi:hypothetical protein
MLHYHGTPITPTSALQELSGCCFCVSFAAPGDIVRCHQIGQSVMLDNGAFSNWTRGKATDWIAYYCWSEKWLAYPTTWAVIPDVIDGTEAEQDQLICQWPYKERGAPVWHMNESLDRLIRLLEDWPRVCIGSTAIYRVVLSSAWQVRMDQVWNELAKRYQRFPWIHLLRGMSCSGKRWPFASVDSTDIGRNHHRPLNSPKTMADRWDAIQCPATWNPKNGYLF